MNFSCPAADLEHVLAHAGPAFESLRHGRIFLTGGSGFWGTWLLESLALARKRLQLNVEVIVLTRSPENFYLAHPSLAGESWLQIHSGDVRNFTFPEGPFTHVIHAATEASARLNREHPGLMAETIALGTQRVLELAVEKNVHRFLLASSGAIYGTFPQGLTHVSEKHIHTDDPSQTLSAYSTGKRLAEKMSLEISKQQGFDCVIARGFAFVGPHLPLDTHFAIGNFISDALRGGPLLIQSDGTGRRSYLYAADMAAWLWTLLASGENGEAYNVGSPVDFSIKEIAEIISRCAGLSGKVQIASLPLSGSPSSVYVPDIQKAREELNLDVWISLEQAVERTLIWLRQKSDP